LHSKYGSGEVNILLQAIYKQSPNSSNADYQTNDHCDRRQSATNGLPGLCIVPCKSLLWCIALRAAIVIRLKTFRKWIESSRGETETYVHQLYILNTNSLKGLSRVGIILPVLRKAWAGSICSHSQDRCVLLSPVKWNLQVVTYRLKLQGEKKIR
jgi:hypothetical protein